jgi:vitamin B12 transporter
MFQMNTKEPLSLKGTVCVCLLFLQICQLHAQESEPQVDTVIVTGTSLDDTIESTGSSVSILTEDQLNSGQYRNALSALKQVPGLDVVQSGPNGGNAAIFLRGGNSEHTLILLDGIELNNPATTNRAYNIANLTLENIERIEVIRGPQSTVYGSDAMGGVINLISKKAKEGVRATVSSEAGTYNSFTQIGNVSYGSQSFDVTTGITRQDVGNISAADAGNGNKEHDDYSNTSLSTRLRFAPTSTIELTNTTRYTRNHTNLDNFGGAGGDDPNRFMRNEEFFTRGDVTTTLLSEQLVPSAYIAYTRHNLEDINNPDRNSVEVLDSEFSGDIVTAGTKLKWVPTSWAATLLGIETQAERADSRYYSDGLFGAYEDNLFGQQARTNSIFGEAKLSYEDRMHLDAGLRYDDHSIFGNRTTFKIAPVVHATETMKLRGSVGTGFKAPSLVQLYSSYGNQNLDAERSLGYDVGIDQVVVPDVWTLSLTYFRTDYENLVTFNPATFVSENIDSSRTQGLEVATNLDVTSAVSARISYTYTDTLNETTGQSLLRRPRNKLTTSLTYKPMKQLSTQIQWRVVSSRYDNDFNRYPPERVSLAGYGLVDVAASYALDPDIEVFARIDNLFDKEYQEVLGFGTMGAAGYAGIKVAL